MTEPGKSIQDPPLNPGEPIRLGLLAPAVVHYHAPLYRALAVDPRLDFTVIFASRAGLEPSDLGFGRKVLMDRVAHEGYRSIFLSRARSDSDLESFWGLSDPDVIFKVWQGRFDVLVLHGYNFATYLMAAAAQRLRGGTLMFREEQTLLHTRSRVRTVVKEVALRALFRRAICLAIGTASRRWFAHYGVAPDRLFTVPYSVDGDRLRAASTELGGRRAALRREFGLPDSKPVLLAVSRLIHKKQPLALLEAFRRARAVEDCALLIVGTGELEPAIRQEIARSSIPNVVLAGFLDQSELPRAYACADVFALFSKEHETWGVVVNEAMNFGLPILVSDKVGSASDLVRPGQNGFVIPRDDIQGMADAISSLTADSELRKRFGRASLEIVEPFTAEAAAAEMLKAVANGVGAERWARAGGQPDDRSPEGTGP